MNKKKLIYKIYDNTKTLLGALLVIFYSVIIFSSFIYLISFFLYSDKFLITLIYSVLFMVLMIYLIYNYKNQIKDLV